MIGLWLGGLLRRRAGRLLATATGIALAVALIAALGSFLASSQATMTARALRSVAVAWQVEVQAGGDAGAVLSTLRSLPGTAAVRTVHTGRTSGLEATTGGTTQTTGPGVVLGIPPGYAATFPDQIRQLSGSPDGVLIAQQTASNLHVRPGDQVSIGLPGAGPRPVTIAGVVDLPQADSLFQKVGAPAQTQPSAPPDNVLLLPEATFTALTGNTAPVTQFHVARDAPASPDPATAYQDEIAAAHNFEAQVAGAALVGNNVGAALDAARGDAAYAQMLFLFLGLPGVVLAALLTSALVEAGGDRRRTEQALLRTRGHTPRTVAGLAVSEAALVAVLGGAAGLGIAALAGRLAFGPAPDGGSGAATAWWYAIAFAAGLLITTLTVLVPAVTGLRQRTVSQARQVIGANRTPWWAKAGLDVLLVAAALVVFQASSGNDYALVLAPEGVPSISVSYWAFLGPALLWLGAAALLWRLTTLVLRHGRAPLRRLLRPLSGRLAAPGAAGISRQRRPLARAIVLLALALSFAASTAVFNRTYQQQAEADAQLTNGADVAVTEPPAAQVTATAGDRLRDVPGVRHVEPIQHRFAYVGADLQDLYGVRPGSIRDATALQDTYFQGGSAADLMTTLANQPDSILVSAETVKDFQLTSGDLINLRVQDARTKALRTVPFRYRGIVKEFPTAPKDSFFVANAAYLAQATGSDAVGAFLVDTGGTGQPGVAEALRARVGTAATVTDITQTRAHVGSSLTSVNLSGLTRLELAFAILIAAGAGGIVLAVGLAERRRGLAIMAVLGARRRHLRGLVLGEGLVLVAGGLLGGAIIAWGVSEMLVKVLTGVFDPPPSSIAVPWAYLTATAAAVVAAVVLAATISARASTRPAVEELRDL
ncbi:FtsX-like permease family protein [Amycolatopsis sp., V23-08]|uniref:FtsX-like permease family protein n=1 Tax=Amycolatopsis heterodermiae TaxID=3110235 RepID=A0ABU5R9Q8_9PSEU|nr:FtsX-like permease family protein [Amycolatopsis sp., V23-08]MEA5362977.1 FtsX-like permease family protein [Amycolatopsis sp., V23-08]